MLKIKKKITYGFHFADFLKTPPTENSRVLKKIPDYYMFQSQISESE